MTIIKSTRMAGAALLAGLSLLLSGCLITPGKFTSELILTEENRFTFTYEGEIFFLGLSKLAEMGNAAEEFEPDPCFVDEVDYEIRECTANELKTQRAAYEAAAGERAAEAAMQSQQMAAMMGGIDPSDPEATAELARLLERQEGWSRVVDKGEGVFDVSYSVSSELGHDFMFPTIEGFPSSNPFVQIHLRDGDVVRVNAPGFSPQEDGSAAGMMLGGLAGFSSLAALGAQEEGGPELPNFPQLEGTFTIVTNGTIRANNTDEGAVKEARGEVLTWEVSPSTQDAPTALIDMSR